jgi:hypothetical protein
MRFVRNLIVASCALAALALLSSPVAPRIFAQVRAALVRDADHPAFNPFVKELCNGPAGCITKVGLHGVPLSNSFVVPAATSTGAPVKRLVIDFVSGECSGGTGRATEVILLADSLPAAGATADTGDNFLQNFFPLALAQYAQAGVTAVASFATPVRIMLNPGMTVSVANNLDVSGPLYCKAQLNGYFVTP